MPPAGEPRVSVVVPTFEEGDAIGPTLERLRAVLPRGGEIVVADGSSGDETRAIASRTARVVAGPRGRGTQMNAGAAAASGDVLVFLHADCWLEAGAIEEACALLGDEGTIAVGFSQRLEGSRLLYRLVERWADLRVRRFRSIYGDSGLALRRATFVEIGGFPDAPLFEDLGISERLRRRGGRFALARSRVHVSIRRWERDGAIRRTLSNWALTARYKAGADPRHLALAYDRR